ncbi:mannosyltransferase [Longimycelium tulufanense]|uniref:Mannosyltransferase n=2 Tax=Longimycelium tulufanense TaxID=907463 RepID=A0A8J3FVF1_9PSEU|nr:mannosyltransferase [Longimycelium tulufanense]
MFGLGRRRHSMLVGDQCVSELGRVPGNGSDPRRIAHFSDTYLPRRCGVGTSLRTLSTALTNTGCDCLSVVPRHPQLPTAPGLLQLPAIPTGLLGLRLAWPSRRHVAVIVDWRPDLVHIHTPGPIGLIGVLTARLLNVPIVHTYHTDLHGQATANRVPVTPLRLGLRLYAHQLRVPLPPVAGGLDAVIDAANGLLVHDADAVVIPCMSILKRVTLPVPAERISCVPTGLAPLPVTPDSAVDFRKRYGIPCTDRLVLFVGRVSPEKNMDLLVTAFRHVLARLPDTRLVLVGLINGWRWLRDMSASVADRVTAIGQQPATTVAAAYAAADVFAFPSLTDTQGLTHQEAALAGVPTVLADLELHKYGPLAGATAYAEPNPDTYAEVLLRLLTNPAEARALGEKARRRARSHTPSRYANDMREIYALAARRRAQSDAQRT